MEKNFDVILLEEAFDFLQEQEKKVQRKILYNLRKVQVAQDAKLFKKLNKYIWEFRTLYQENQYRLLAFWDKDQPQLALVCATHGFLKKTDKVPKKEIEKAEQIHKAYFEQKER